MRFLIISSLVFCLLLSAAGVATAAELPGPDEFGYTAESIPFNLRDLTTSETSESLSLSDDDVSDPILLPFRFNFYGVDYEEVFVSSNGFVTFSPGSDDGCCEGNPLPSPDDVNNVIAGFWQDLNPRNQGIIRYETLGSEESREFVVGFYEVPHYRGPPITFEIILHEGSNAIELQYGSAPTSHTVGIENAEGTIGLQVAVGFLNEGFLFTLAQEINVPINISPFSCPNNQLWVNPGFWHKRLRVAVSGEEFDVTSIDPDTVTLEGVAPIYYKVRDICMVELKTHSSEESGTEFCYCRQKHRDGNDDLVVVFSAAEVVNKLKTDLGRDLEGNEPLTLTLTGNLTDGTRIVGEDLVISKKRPRH